MNKTIKVFLIIILIISVLLILNSASIAAGSPDVSIIIDDVSSSDEFIGIGEYALGVVQVVGSFISVIALIVIGIKYMIGSIEERAEYKKSMIPYIIGAVMLFASSNIAKIIYDAAQSIK